MDRPHNEEELKDGWPEQSELGIKHDRYVPVNLVIELVELFDRPMSCMCHDFCVREYMIELEERCDILK